jgi:transcriptional regulator with XRE-family HTH domain
LIEGEFPARLLLVLKALSLSRGLLAQELAVDKSVVSRWLSGRQSPTGENLANLTRLVASHRPGFTILDWESDLDALSAKLGVVEAPVANPFGPLGGWLPEEVLAEAKTLTALRGPDYEGFWRVTRPAISAPGRFIHDHIMLRRDDNGFLRFRLWTEDMRFEGWTFLTQTQLFSIGADAKSGLLTFSIYNAVMRHKAQRMDGLHLAVQRIGGGSPVALASIVDRCGDLCGDPAVDDATYAELTKGNVLAPEGSVPDEIANHIFKDEIGRAHV